MKTDLWAANIENGISICLPLIISAEYSTDQNTNTAIGVREFIAPRAELPMFKI